jgi:hypothetical protein
MSEPQDTSTLGLLNSAISNSGSTTTESGGTPIVEERLQPSDISIDEESGEELQETVETPSSDEVEETDLEDQEKDQPVSDENVEFIKVTDHRGRKVNLKVDYADKDKIKRAYSLAAGARKWQAERDDLQRWKDDNSKSIENWGTISSVYEDSGIDGLINFLEGDGGVDKYLETKNQEREFFNSASPEQLEAYQLKQAQSQKDRELEKLRKEIDDIKNGQQSQKEEQELSSLKSEIYPVFDKYRFAGKLGNPTHENMLDEMLWSSAMKQLEGFPEDMEVTSQQVQKIFRDYSNNLRTLVNKEAEKKVTKTVAKKKRSATENAQKKAVKGMNQPSKTANDLIREGRIGDLFRMASKNKNFVR